MRLAFEKETVAAKFADPSGAPIERPVEIRVNPITQRSCRIAFSRIAEKETGTETLPAPPPHADDTSICPFCRPQVFSRTPTLPAGFHPGGRMVRGESILFPNLFPYGAYSAVSLFDDRHFVEIGTAPLSSYTDSFINCADYLKKICANDPETVFMAITQNHLPSAGGSLLHPHLQVHADRIASNHHRQLLSRSETYFSETGSKIFSDYAESEKNAGTRYIGKTGSWEWMAAFAPEGFFEIWGILPGVASLRQMDAETWRDLAGGVLNTQRFYRSLCRNGYNLGILFAEDGQNHFEVRASMLVRSNYASWVRNDHTGYEVMLGDMATFTLPEETAEKARRFWV